MSGLPRFHKPCISARWLARRHDAFLRLQPCKEISVRRVEHGARWSNSEIPILELRAPLMSPQHSPPQFDRRIVLNVIIDNGASRAWAPRVICPSANDPQAWLVGPSRTTRYAPYRSRLMIPAPRSMLARRVIARFSTRGARIAMTISTRHSLTWTTSWLSRHRGGVRTVTAQGHRRALDQIALAGAVHSRKVPAKLARAYVRDARYQSYKT